MHDTKIIPVNNNDLKKLCGSSFLINNYHNYTVTRPSTHKKIALEIGQTDCAFNCLVCFDVKRLLDLEKHLSFIF